MVKFGLKLDELETFPGFAKLLIWFAKLLIWWVAGSSETNANLAQLGLELGLSLAKHIKELHSDKSLAGLKIKGKGPR